MLQIPASGKEWGAATYTPSGDGHTFRYMYVARFFARAPDAVVSCLGGLTMLKLPRRMPFSMCPITKINWRE
jgi:hypothetical protein